MINYPHFNPGKLEVFTGPMRSGKTRELLNKVDKLSYMNDIESTLIKPKLDTRSEEVETRFGNLSFPCQFIDENSPERIIEKSGSKPGLIAIDEAHFFSGKIVEVIEKLLSKDYNILISGLDLNFRSETFGPMGDILARADNVRKLTAICCYEDCNRAASRTQRLVDGSPARYESPLVLIGDEEEGYEPRCLSHHKVPGKKP